jgi:hypothetical protein
MTDISLIEKHYSRMSDEELKRLSQIDGEYLTTEATSALYREFIKRKLDTAIFPSLRAYKLEENRRQAETRQEEFAASVLAYCFESKSEGKTDTEIFYGLKESGLSNKQSIMLINSLESRSIILQKVYDNEQLTGSVICVIGILFYAFTYSSALSSLANTISCYPILYGAIRFFRGLNQKSKFSKVLRIIEEQKQD